MGEGIRLEGRKGSEAEQKYDTSFTNNSNFTPWVKNTFFRLADIHREIRTLTLCAGNSNPGK